MKTILIVDNFDSFTFNLVEYFKRLGLKVIVYRNTLKSEIIEKLKPDAIVFSPGPSVPNNAGNMMAIIKKYHKKYPILGVCLGHQALIESFGGKLKFLEPVHGESSSIHHDGKTIFKDLTQDFEAGRYHSLAGDKIPACFEVSATHKDIVMAIRHKTLPIEGVQFHPESILTMKGDAGFRIIKNFVTTYLGSGNKLNLDAFLEKSVSGKLTLEEQEVFLKNKTTVTPQELKKAVEFLQKQCPKRLTLKDAIDICGTGGSGLTRINTSTIAAFILASCGVKIAKHGNKAASGRFGSFDLIEALGIPFEVSPEEQEECFEKNDLCFLYARTFHPVMKQFAAVRKKIGKPSFFNLLGPLLSPVHVNKQIIGTSFEEHMKLIVQTCKLLGKEHVLVIRGNDGLDEVTLTGKTDVVELCNGKIKKYSIEPKDFGIEPAPFSSIQGGDAQRNTDIAYKILQNKCETRHKDLVLVNAALALKFVGKAKTLKEAYMMAGQSIESDAVQSLLLQMKTPSILHEIVANKKDELKVRKKKMSLSRIKKGLNESDRDFKAALQKEGLSLIAEIKKASPNMLLKKADPSVSSIAKVYEESGVSAISVLCDNKYFKGSLDDLQKAGNATRKTPILCKDFIIDEYQIFEARSYGADAVLLIASILTQEQISHFLKIARSLKMDAISEVHDKKELEKVLQIGADIIGVNNRDLHTFAIDLSRTSTLAALIPTNKVLISESGIHSRKDIDQLPGRVNAILLGTSLMKAKNPGHKIKELLGASQKLLKVCGIRTEKVAQACESMGIDFVGLNFVPTSKRKISLKKATSILKYISEAKSVGVFQNQDIDEVNKIAQELDLDFIQLSGDETLSYIKQCKTPVIKVIKLKNASDLQDINKYVNHVEMIILDGPRSGSGTPFNPNILRKLDAEVLVAGGITHRNLKPLLCNAYVKGIDIASGVEENGQISINKIKTILNQLKSC